MYTHTFAAIGRLDGDNDFLVEHISMSAETAQKAKPLNKHDHDSGLTQAFEKKAIHTWTNPSNRS